jgi:hypothetical protein
MIRGPKRELRAASGSCPHRYKKKTKRLCKEPGSLRTFGPDQQAWMEASGYGRY